MLPLGFPGTKFPARGADPSGAGCAGRGQGAGPAHPAAPFAPVRSCCGRHGWSGAAGRHSPSRPALRTGHRGGQHSIPSPARVPRSLEKPSPKGEARVKGLSKPETRWALYPNSGLWTLVNVTRFYQGVTIVTYNIKCHSLESLTPGHSTAQHTTAPHFPAAGVGACAAALL